MKQYSRYDTQIFIKPLNFFENDGIYAGTQIELKITEDENEKQIKQQLTQRILQ